MFLVRLFLLPFRLALATVVTTFRLGLRIGSLPIRAGGRAVRVVGFRGWIFLGIGVVVGLLLAPTTGRELRRKLQSLATGGADTGPDLAEKVAFELAHAPRTWHLAQPRVTATAGEVVLEGVVADDDARDELGRVAAAIPGVVRVDNRLELAADSPA